MHFELRWYADGASNLSIEVWDSSASDFTVEYHRILGRLISRVTLFKPSIFVSSYGTEV